MKKGDGNMKEIEKKTEKAMKKTIESFQSELGKLRTGRAHPSLLDHVRVNYYGAQMPVNQVAKVSAQDARTLVVQPFEKSMVPVIEKAIMESDLGLNPAASSDVIRIPIPALTEERRKEMVKVLRQEAEKARIGVRNHRREANDELKKLYKDKTISEDEEHRGEEAVQKITDRYIQEIDDILVQREADIMKV